MSMFTTRSRFTGLSGIDTQSMIEAIMSSESMRYNKLIKNNISTQWRQDAYRSAAAKFTSFSNKFLEIGSSNNLRSSNTVSANKASVTGATPNAVTVTSSTAAPAGSYKIAINQLAQKDRFVSGNDNAVSGSIKSDGITSGSVQAGDKLSITLNSTTRVIEFSEADAAAMNDPNITDAALKDLLDEKINAVFSNGTSRIDVSVNNGSIEIKGLNGSTVSISEVGSGREPNTLTGHMHALLTSESFENDLADRTDTLSFAVSGTDIDIDLTDIKNISELTSAINAKLSEATGGQLRALFSEDNGFQISTSGATTQEFSISGLQQLGIQDATIGHTSMLKGLGLQTGSSTAVTQDTELFEALGIDDTSDLSPAFTINGKAINVTADMTIQEFVRQVNDSGADVTMTFSASTGQFSLESNKSGEQNKISIDTPASGPNVFTQIFGSTNPTQNAQDAIFTLNGTEMRWDTNDVNLDNLRLTLNETTGADGIDISVSKDASEGMQIIKDFVEAYNDLIISTNALTRTNPRESRGFGPLTDDEKKGMTETQIKDWEQKAKIGILYNDPALRDLTSRMRTEIYQSVELPNGGKISLFELGITTSSTHTDGRLIIDEEKLKTALEERGDDVATLFAGSSSNPGIADRIYSVIQSGVGRSGTITNLAGLEISPLSMVPDNNRLGKQMKETSDRIEELRLRLARREEQLYAMFSRMETAMAESNSTMSYLLSSMGM